MNAESKDIFITACFHKFHSNCILRWASEYRNETCPICRSPSLSAAKNRKGKKLFNIYEETSPRENPNFPRKLTYNGEIGHNLTYPDKLVQKQLNFSNNDTLRPKRTTSQQRQQASHRSKENPHKESIKRSNKLEDEKQRKIEEKRKKELAKARRKEEKRILAEEEVTKMLLGEERKEKIENLCLKFRRQILAAKIMNEDQKQNVLNRIMGLIAKSNNSIQTIVFEKWRSNIKKLLNAERKSQIEDAQKKQKQMQEMQQKLNEKNNIIVQITKKQYDNNIKKLVFEN
jgi:hypothetical protein